MNILEKEIKAQPLRLFDVFVLAPLLMYAGTRRAPLTRNMRLFLGVASVAIFSYELKNYLEIRAREKAIR